MCINATLANYYSDKYVIMVLFLIPQCKVLSHARVNGNDPCHRNVTQMYDVDAGDALAVNNDNISD